MSIPNYCIIEPGTLSGKLIADHGCYADMGVKLLKGCLDDFNYATCKVDGGEILPNPDEFDGCLVLGSEHGVNDNLPWIEPLLDFIRQVYDRRIPLVGVCFGHQAIAQSLGGRVEKTDWNVGVDRYDSKVGDVHFHTIVYHQDQVVELPKSAAVEFSSERCPNAALKYIDSPCWTIQSHPEFQLDFASDLFEDTRYDPLSYTQCDQAKRDLDIFSVELGTIENGIRQAFANKA